MSGTAGKVALANGTTTLGCNTAATCAANGNDTRIIDLIGYGTTANYFEGAAPAPAPSNTSADFRNDGGCLNTDVNSADFTAGTPSPRTSDSPATSARPTNRRSWPRPLPERRERGAHRLEHHGHL